MAPPASKKRKISHSPPPEIEADDASFASGDDEVEDADDSGNREEDDMEDTHEEDAELDDLDNLNQDEEGASDEDEDEDAEEELDGGGEAAGSKARKSNGQAAKPKVASSRPGRGDAATASGGAYTGGTFKSNMFKLQVDEMLNHIRPKHGKREALAEATLHKLRNAIEQIPAREPLPIIEAERNLIKKSKVAVPFPEPRPTHDAKYKLEYAKPANINIAGSYPLKLSTRTSESLVVDMVITMPATMFQEKDYLNHRYFYKRAYYLACIAAGIQPSFSGDLTMVFDLLNGNPLQPILAVSPKPEAGNGTLHKWRINIIPAISESVFAKDKLLPSKNCVRPTNPTEAEDGTQKLLATPFYNSSLQSDTQITAYLKVLHGASGRCEAFKDACLLGRVWLRQRGLSGDIAQGGFGNFEWAAMMAVLLQTGGPSGVPLLSPGYSSYQLFKATLQYLSVKDLVKQPAVLQAEGVKLTSQDGQPIFFDGARNHNVLFKVTPWAYKQLRKNARTTLLMLGDALFDQFEASFILREDVLLQKSDIVTTIPASALVPSSEADRDFLQRYNKLHSVLSRGLGDRITEVRLQFPATEQWALGSARPVAGRKGLVVVAITFDPANINRAVDHGPSAESKKEAAEFRRFWGERAELRRFRDGSILESLVWSAEGGVSIVQQIVAYLLERHFDKEVSGAAAFYGEVLARFVKHNSGTGSFLPVMEAFKTLENDIRGMEEMPLAIRQILPASSQLCYSSIDVPMAGMQKHMKNPADVVIQFEGSGRWPDDLVAIQRTKIAFLLKLNELFQGSAPGVTARLGLENEEVDILNQAYLDVIYANGSAFRLRIHHDREQTLIDRILKDKSADPRSKESAAVALAVYKRDFVKTPAHAQAVAKLCTRHPALSPTIRLVKKWFASHLLASHFAPELLELIAIRAFVQPWPWQAPSSPQAGFLRTLAFLSRWDWRADPLIVDLGGDMKPADVQAITTRFEAWRKLDPALNRVAVFAASSVDPEGTTWTDGTPVRVVAGRMSALAKAATQAAETRALQLEPASLFVSPLADYDFVLHLSSGFAEDGRKKKKNKSVQQFKNLVVQDEARAELVGFRPIDAYLQELRNLYGQAFVLFYGGGESKAVGGLWSPQTGKRTWKVNLAYSTLPVKGEEEGDVDTVINKEGILAEIARLGGDMIERVEVNR